MSMLVTTTRGLNPSFRNRSCAVALAMAALFIAPQPGHAKSPMEIESGQSMVVQRASRALAADRTANDRYRGFSAYRGVNVPPFARPIARLNDGTNLFLLDQEAVSRGHKAPANAERLPGLGPWPTGRVHVRVRGDMMRNSRALAADHNLRFLRPFQVGSWVLFDAGSGAAATRRMKGLTVDPRVDAVELDYLRRLDVRDARDNVLFDRQWHLENNGDLPGYTIPPISGADADVTAAWNTTFGSSDVVIAVLDSGQDPGHPDFAGAGKIRAPFDAMNGIVGTSQPTPGDFEAAHGIACAGLAAASREGTTGVVGVCPDCSVMPIRILAAGEFGIDTAIADAFMHAFQQGASVASNSWGYGGVEFPPQLVRDTLQLLVDEGRGGLGMLIVFAIGNTGEESVPQEIALDPRVLAVGGTGADDQRVAYSTFADEIDIMAPTGHASDEATGRYLGPGLVTSDRPGDDGYNPTLDDIIEPGLISDLDYTAIMSGTSGACPIVAGVAGLLLSTAPDLSYGQVFRLMTDTANKVGPVPYNAIGWNREYGYGRVTARLALQFLALDQICVISTEICDDGIDNDCDLSVDAADLDCGFTPPVSNVPLGALCQLDEDCDGGICVPFGESNGGNCTTVCFGGECPNNGSCISFDAEGQEVPLCLASCEGVACPDSTICTLAQGERVCLPPCGNGFSLCPIELACGDPALPCGGGGVEPDVVEPGVVTPDVNPEVAEPDVVEPGPSVVEPDGTTPRRKPARVRIAAVGCTETGTPSVALFSLGLLAVFTRRRRRSRSA